MSIRGVHRFSLALLTCVAIAAPITAMAQSSLMAPAVSAHNDSILFTAERHTEADPSGKTITDISVIGTQRLEPETVTSYLTVNKGDVATPDKMDASLKKLYATGLFSDVRMAIDDAGILHIKVTENPVINRVTYEGNDAISHDDLEKEVQLKSRSIYTVPSVQRDVQRILDLYRRSGRFAATVEPKIVQLEQNRVDLVFEINEGKRTGVRSIKFVGNAHFDEAELRSVVNTRESAWWRFFSTSDYYDPDRLNYDKELLRRFYLNEGYVDFRVLSAVAELTPDHKDFFITYTIEEGPRYKFGKIKVTSEIKGVGSDKLQRDVTTRSGSWYDADQIEKSISKLSTVLGDMQYAFVNITPNPDRHKETLTVDLDYTVKQGERVYIGRIDINGNHRTVDKVIRREMQVAEGDPFNSTKLHQSEQKLKDLGFFENVTVAPSDGAQPDRANVKVDLKEKSTGEVSIGAGFSSTDGPLGDFSIAEHNFMGKGQDVRFGAQVSGRTKQIDTSFTEPYFLDRDLSAGVDLFHTQTDNQDLSSYNVDESGLTLRLGYPLSQEIRQRLNYSFHADSISNVPSTASLYVLQQQGATVTSSVGQSLIYDTRDSKLDPTLGFLTHFDTDVAGAGGSRKWLKVRLGGTQYYPIADKWVLSGTAEAGQIWGLNGSTRINERFYLGGDTLRGFQYAGIGPRDETSTYQDALGGNRYTRGSIELQTPLPVPDEFGLKGHIFTDAGTLGKPDVNQIPGDTLVEDESLHVSAGVGISWQSPFGPVRLDFAEPLIYKSYDKLEHIHFSFGTKF